MAQRRRQSLKAQRQDKKRHAHNVRIKTALKKTLKELQASIAGKKIEEAKKHLKNAISQLAKAAKKDIIHKNTAVRKISRLNKKVAKLAVSLP